MRYNIKSDENWCTCLFSGCYEILNESSLTRTSPRNQSVWEAVVRGSQVSSDENRKLMKLLKNDKYAETSGNRENRKITFSTSQHVFHHHL